METTLSPMLTVCGIEELPGQSSRNVTHVLSIVDPELPDLEAFDAYGEHRRTILRFHDIIEAAPNRVMPRPDHVEAILRFGTDFLMREDREAASHVLVHCHMGVSRSTAAMLTLMAQANPEESGEKLFARLAAIRPQAWPNSQMIVFADELLGRAGELTTALGRHYGRQIKSRPEFSEWMTSLGRQAELQMAIHD
ncbi:tyrosine phosphatase family protein [Ensifer sp. B1-9]|uniref:tyrosine phosphatase family protein n=1 Tax=Ensifer sp. B1-9 TaxID=3141455 RepID=UPI003D2157CC